MAGSPVFTAIQYLKYLRRANGAQKIHSPFVYDLYTGLIKRASKNKLPEIEALRKQLYTNHDLLDLVDLKRNESRRSTIRSVAKSSLSSPKFSAFLRMLIDQLAVKVVLETGTSFGLNTLYLASSNAQKIITIEASSAISSIARNHFQSLSNEKIELINATLADSFVHALVKHQPEMVFLDADHRGATTLQFIEDVLKQVSEVRCIVLHDIYWSNDMRNMWNQVIEDERFNLTIDIFCAGLIFPRMDMPKQHFTLRF